MATVKAEGKSAFLKEFFVDHPDAGEPAINEAWRTAGHDGSISTSLISKVRSDLGLTGKGRSKSKGAQAVGAGKRSFGAPKSNGRRTGPEAGGRPAARANVRTAMVSSERPAEALAAGKAGTRVLIRLEGQIDEMLHEIKQAGGLPVFEDAACGKARRIHNWSALTGRRRISSLGRIDKCDQGLASNLCASPLAFCRQRRRMAGRCIYHDRDEFRQKLESLFRGFIKFLPDFWDVMMDALSEPTRLPKP